MPKSQIPTPKRDSPSQPPPDRIEAAPAAPAGPAERRLAEGRTLIRGLTAWRWALRLLLAADLTALAALFVFCLFQLVADDGRDPSSVSGTVLGLQTGTIVLCAPGLSLWAMGAGFMARAPLGSMWSRYLRTSQLCCLLPLAGTAVLLDRTDRGFMPATTIAFLLLPACLAPAYPALGDLARLLKQPELAGEAWRRLRGLWMHPLAALTLGGLGGMRNRRLLFERLRKCPPAPKRGTTSTDTP